jgi:aminomethyltransferase
MRSSVLNSQHIALGSKLDGDSWNDMHVPWSYSTDPHDEVVAVRSAAGLFDISALNLVDVSGPDAESVLNSLVAKDVTKLKAGHAIIAAELNAAGALCDDIMIIREGVSQFKLSHGSGATRQNLQLLAEGKNVDIASDNDTHIVSLQGPKALAILAPQTSCDLAALPYFSFIKTSLFGVAVTIGRGGYAGERGYEIYSAAKDMVNLWEKILKCGQPFGLVPASWNCLELTRVEAGLQFFPFEMPEGDTTPWEAGLGWAVDVGKVADYTGKAAVLKLRAQPRVQHVGLVCHSAVAVEAGAKIYKDGIEIGVITSSSYSQYLMLSLALAHVKPNYTEIGTKLEVIGSTASCSARVAQTPFYDPMRLRSHPEKFQG